METSIKDAMGRGGIADITTTGRNSGLDRRIEIYFHQIDGDYYLTGKPGRKRDWEANIKANPEFTLHLKRGLSADVPVVGELEQNPEVRREILFKALTESWGTEPDQVRGYLDYWVETAPFIRFRPAD